jgi:hypothetical protein
VIFQLIGFGDKGPDLVTADIQEVMAVAAADFIPLIKAWMDGELGFEDP